MEKRLGPPAPDGLTASGLRHFSTFLHGFFLSPLDIPPRLVHQEVALARHKLSSPLARVEATFLLSSLKVPAVPFSPPILSNS